MGGGEVGMGRNRRVGLRWLMRDEESRTRAFGGGVVARAGAASLSGEGCSCLSNAGSVGEVGSADVWFIASGPIGCFRIGLLSGL